MARKSNTQKRVEAVELVFKRIVTRLENGDYDAKAAYDPLAGANFMASKLLGKDSPDCWDLFYEYETKILKQGG